MARTGIVAGAARHAGLPLLAVLLFGGFVVLWRDFQPLYFRILLGEGQHPFWFPFLDTHAVLASIECKRMGFDVYVASPCDVLNRPHVYSPLFLWLSFLPVSVRATAAVGVALNLGFFLALGALPTPSGWRAWSLMVLATVSNMTIYAVERANNDLIIFIIVAIAGRLLLRAPAARWVGYALVMLAALLKFYPVTLMALALRERPRVFAVLALVSSAVLAVFAVHYRVELTTVFAQTPTGSYFTDFFGAVNLPRGMAELLTPLGTVYPAVAPLLPYLPWIIFLALIASCARTAFAGAGSEETRARFAAVPAPHALFLTIGAVTIVSCFFAGQNIDYRGIAFLFLLPGLCALESGADGRAWPRGAAAVVFLTWAEFFRHGIELAAGAMGFSPAVERAAEAAFWLLKELVWWRVVGLLIGVIVCFALDSEIGESLRRLVPARRLRSGT